MISWVQNVANMVCRGTVQYCRVCTYGNPSFCESVSATTALFAIGHRSHAPATSLHGASMEIYAGKLPHDQHDQLLLQHPRAGPAPSSRPPLRRRRRGGDEERARLLLQHPLAGLFIETTVTTASSMGIRSRHSRGVVERMPQRARRCGGAAGEGPRRSRLGLRGARSTGGAAGSWSLEPLQHMQEEKLQPQLEEEK